MGFFSRLLAFIFLEKKARDRLARRQQPRGAAGPASNPSGTPAGAASGQHPAVDAGQQMEIDAGGHVMTPERVRIIAEALKVVERKQDILADLSEEDRRKLIDTLTGKDTGKRE